MTATSNDEEWEKKIKDLEAKGLLYTGPVIQSESRNTKNTFQFQGGFLVKREGKYWIMFQSGGHGGPDIIKEVTEAEYIGGRYGTVSIVALLEKYKERKYDMNDGAAIRERWKEKGIYEESNE